MNTSLHDYLTRITTISEQLKKTNITSNFSEKNFFSEIRKEPFFIEVKELRAEVEKSFQALLDGPTTSKEALSKLEMSQSITTGEKNTNFVSVKEHELMCSLKSLCSF